MIQTPVVNTKFNAQELEQRVKDMYREVALHPEVTYHFEMGRALAERLGYPSEILDQIPSEAIASFAGVGYYFDLARLKAGEVVVDLGSGSGMDVFYAATQVGQSGEVIGLDMTLAQLNKANQLKQRHHFAQVDFLESYIETPPIVSGCADAVISNGVINLSSRKDQVFQEAARMLKTGGRLVLSDIVSTTKLPESISCNVSLWAACIGGAIPESEYLALIKAAGLKVIQVKENPYQFLSKGAKGATAKYGIKSISVLAVKM
ncbi:MAG: methyltransferase domain-containing protein [Bacteroidota bacterium]